MASDGGIPEIPPEGFPPAILALLLRIVAFGEPPPGADRTMTTRSPEQRWFTVMSVTTLVIPGLFLAARIYTKVVLVRSLEPADCKSQRLELGLY